MKPWGTIPSAVGVGGADLSPINANVVRTKV